jgi:hypothetical protein
VRLMVVFTICALPFVVPRPAAAQQLRAKVPQESARAAALARVPNGSVQAMQLKVERGTMVYIYDIAVPGGSGLDEVRVSAVDGRVVSVEHLGGSEGQPPAASKSVAERGRGPAPPQH